MAIAFAAEPETPLLDVFLEAGKKLELAKSADRDSLHLFDRSVEWRHLTHAVELKDSLGHMVRDFGFPPEFLGDMLRFYDERTAAGGTSTGRFDRPWRYHRRLQLWAGGARDREFQRLRNRLIVNLIGRDAAHAQLRPAGGVALQWAKLLHDEA
jgi:CRISPR-associated protein Csm1